MHEERTSQPDSDKFRFTISNFTLSIDCFFESQEHNHHLENDCQENLNHKLSMNERIVVTMNFKISEAIDISLKIQSYHFLIVIAGIFSFLLFGLYRFLKIFFLELFNLVNCVLTNLNLVLMECIEFIIHSQRHNENQNQVCSNP